MAGLCAARMSVRDAAQLMVNGRHTALLVVSDPNAPQPVLEGIVTERDILRRVVVKELNVDTTLVSSVMTRKPDVINVQDDSIHALELMIRRGYRHLPVVEQLACSITSVKETPVGLVDILSLTLTGAKSALDVQQPHPSSTASKDSTSSSTPSTTNASCENIIVDEDRVTNGLSDLDNASPDITCATLNGGDVDMTDAAASKEIAVTEEEESRQSTSGKTAQPFSRLQSATNGAKALCEEANALACAFRFHNAVSMLERAQRKVGIARRLGDRAKSAPSDSSTNEELLKGLRAEVCALQIQVPYMLGQMQVFTNSVNDGISSLFDSLSRLRDAAKEYGITQSIGKDEAKPVAGSERSEFALCCDTLERLRLLGATSDFLKPQSHFVEDLISCLADVLTDVGIDRYEEAGRLLQMLPLPLSTESTGSASLTKKSGYYRTRLRGKLGDKLDRLMTLGKEQFSLRCVVDASTYYTLALRLATSLDAEVAVARAAVSATKSTRKDINDDPPSSPSTQWANLSWANARIQHLLPRILSNRAACCMAQGQYARAANDCRKCIAQDSSFAKGYSRLSTCLLQLNQAEDALGVALDGISEVTKALTASTEGSGAAAAAAAAAITGDQSAMIQTQTAVLRECVAKAEARLPGPALSKETNNSFQGEEEMQEGQDEKDHDEEGEDNAEEDEEEGEDDDDDYEEDEDDDDGGDDSAGMLNFLGQLERRILEKEAN